MDARMVCRMVCMDWLVQSWPLAPGIGNSGGTNATMEDATARLSLDPALGHLRYVR
jgi:hypothetical protein